MNMKPIVNSGGILRAPLSMMLNLALVYVAYGICRIAYLLENWSTFAPNLTWGAMAEILRGGWMFDTSAILYTNALYIVMMILPLHWKETAVWQRAARLVFIVFNGLCVAINLADAVYFK